MEELIKMARELGVAIQKSEVYTNIQTATEANDGDEALQKQIDEFNTTRQEMSMMMQAGDNKDEAKMEEMDAKLKSLYESVMGNENMTKFNSAKDQVDQLMNGIQTIIMGSINGDDPATINPFPEADGCGSGGCSGCGGGCH